MRKNIHHQESYKYMINRIEKLSPDSPRLFGTMSVGEMLCHLSDQLRLALNEKPMLTQSTLFDRTIYKWIALYAIQKMPRNLKTIKEMEQGIGKAGTLPATFAADRATFLRLLKTFRQEANHLSPHPLFGKLTAYEWGRLVFMHIDYHLKQFSN